MTITMNIPDAQAPRFIDAICTAYNYQATIVDPLGIQPSVPNPVTKGQFARQQAINILVNLVKDLEVRIASVGYAQTVTPIAIT